MKNLKNIHLVLGLLLVLITPVFATETVQQQTYGSKVILSAPWGQNPGEFGLDNPYAHNSKAHDLGPIQGPSTFTIAPNGDIYVCDTFNGRIQRFSPAGNLITVISGRAGYGDDICIDQNQDIYVLYGSAAPPRVLKYDQAGNLLKEYVSFQDEDAKGMNYGGGSTKLYCDNSGRLFLSYYRENSRMQAIFQFGTTAGDYAPAQQKATLRKGFAGTSGFILDKGQILQEIEGKMASVDNTGKVVTEYNISAGSFSFFDIDPQGNVYMHAYVQKDEEISEKVRKYTANGALISEIAWKSTGYAIHNLNKSLSIDSQGNIYVFDSTKDGITITKWSPSRANK
ncbi:MAG: hypothetical protein MUP17_03180 [candidate division Zixibacteria bacterium]|nr:hypothetical protein [candidate division Zixibacteria bacterium]